MGLYCLLRQNQSSETEMQYFGEITACDPSTYIMDHPDLTVSNFMVNVSFIRVNKYLDYLYVFLSFVFPSFPLKYQ